MPERSLGLYIHIPFCVRKCSYCDFCSRPSVKQETIDDYVEKLLFEISEKSKSCGDYVVDTVYFGGGTPTLLSIRQFERILDRIRGAYRVSGTAEITTEGNPGTVSPEYLRGLRTAGLNRLSLGVQSLQDHELKALGRIHTAAQAETAYTDARKAGFDNVSLDLMFGIPEQTAGSFEKTLRSVLSWQPEHLSVYGLILEEGTPFWDRRDTLPLPDEDTERSMYMNAVDALNDRGYSQYEISNFARPGFRSRHNYRYWNLDSYLGFGVSAHSFMDRQRFHHGTSVENYLAHPLETEADESLSDHGLAEEYLMMRFRLTDGVNPAVFEEKTGVSFDIYRKRLGKYEINGLVRFDGTSYSLTPSGFYLSNAILSDILDLND